MTIAAWARRPCQVIHSVDPTVTEAEHLQKLLDDGDVECCVVCFRDMPERGRRNTRRWCRGGSPRSPAGSDGSVVR